MESQDEDFEHRVRGLVSLEGDTDAISVQLRLLPPSSKVMVLLPLSSEIQRLDGTADFDARSYTRLVHETLAKRIERARSFLQSATIDQPRLVFMNGGCLSARMICVSTICENLTHGNIKEAEMLFDDIVKDGVASLLEPPPVAVKKMKKEKRYEVPTLRATDTRIFSEKYAWEVSHREPDSVTAAIDAADALYRDTASLQPSMWDNVEMAKTTEFVPDVGDTSWDISQDLLEFRTAVQVDVKDATKARKIYFDSKRSTVNPRRQSRSMSRPVSAEVTSCVNRTELCQETRTTSEKRWSLPHGLPPLNLGGTRVFDPQSAQKSIKRPQSVGDPSRTSLIPTGKASARSVRSLEPTKSSDTALERGNARGGSPAFENLPRTNYVKPPETNLDGILQMATSKIDDRSQLVDRGADREDLNGSELNPPVANSAMNIKVPAQSRPLFAIVEELIVHVSAGEDDEVLESVIRSYKHCGYSNSALRDARLLRQPVSPTSFSSHDSKMSSEILATTDADTYDTMNGRRDVAPRHSRGRRDKYEDDSPNISNIRHVRQSKKPDQKPLNLSHSVRDSFSAITNAVGVQNSIRALLNVHFPPKSTQHKQHIFPLENDRFWKPVFSNDDSLRSESNTVDLMLALGIEDGVDQNFCKDIADRVEKLGMDGALGNRIRKLDIRYLVVRAMETFTTQPLAFQADENPFKQPSLLATLMIPHLEIFLSCNDPTSILLLYYPPSHLATVLALRELVGAEMMRVAGIVNSLSLMSNSSRDSYASIISRFSASFQSPPTSPNRSRTSCNKSQQDDVDARLFSKADFLLASTATDSQISQFLTSIFLTLPGSGSFYLPSTTNPSSAYSEPQLQPLKPLSPMSPSNPLSLTHEMGNFPSPPRTLYSPTGKPLPQTRPPKKSVKEMHQSPSRVQLGESLDKEMQISLDDTRGMLSKGKQRSGEDIARMQGRQTSKEMIATASQRLRRTRESSKEWSYISTDLELESEYDEWERTFIPQMAKRIMTPQKALRWLGLV